jgi:phenylpyruvate tautomerase PptA (4-oxalocrotonate tautomerase family)
MPFIEIQGPPIDREARAALARVATDELVATYTIDPGIVTTYFIDIEPGSYAHGARWAARTKLSACS